MELKNSYFFLACFPDRLLVTCLVVLLLLLLTFFPPLITVFAAFLPTALPAVLPAFPLPGPVAGLEDWVSGLFAGGGWVRGLFAGGGCWSWAEGSLLRDLALGAGGVVAVGVLAAMREDLRTGVEAGGLLMRTCLDCAGWTANFAPRCSLFGARVRGPCP